MRLVKNIAYLQKEPFLTTAKLVEKGMNIWVFPNEQTCGHQRWKSIPAKWKINETDLRVSRIAAAGKHRDAIDFSDNRFVSELFIAIGARAGLLPAGFGGSKRQAKKCNGTHRLSDAKRCRTFLGTKREVLFAQKELQGRGEDFFIAQFSFPVSYDRPKQQTF